MSEQISSDFYKVPNVKIDILRLRTELEDVLKKKNSTHRYLALWSNFY